MGRSLWERVLLGGLHRAEEGRRGGTWSVLPMQNKKAASWTNTRREYVTKPPCRNAQGSEPYCERSKSEDSNVAQGLQVGILLSLFLC